MTSKEAIGLLLSAYEDEVIKGGRGCEKTSFRTALLMGANAIDLLEKIQNVESDNWEEYEFESIIPVGYDENGEIVIHKYIGYKCSKCGCRKGNRRDNYCANCGIKMKVD